MRNLGFGLDPSVVQAGRKMTYVTITGTIPSEVLMATVGTLTFGTSTTRFRFHTADADHLVASVAASEPLVRFSSIISNLIDEYKRMTAPLADVFVVAPILYTTIADGLRFFIPCVRFSATESTLNATQEMTFFDDDVEIATVIGGSFEAVAATLAAQNAYEGTNHFQVNSTWLDVSALSDGASTTESTPVATESWLSTLTTTQMFWAGVAASVAIIKIIG